MKCTSLLVGLALFSFTASAAPTEAQKAACQAKVERIVRAVAKNLGMGNGVGQLGGAQLSDSRKLENGNVVYVYSGGPLASENMDGYLSGTGATTEVVFNAKGCEISRFTIATGADR